MRRQPAQDFDGIPRLISEAYLHQNPGAPDRFNLKIIAGAQTFDFQISAHKLLPMAVLCVAGRRAYETSVN